jgi:hypothetical protein
MAALLRRFHNTTPSHLFALLGIAGFVLGWALFAVALWRTQLVSRLFAGRDPRVHRARIRRLGSPAARIAARRTPLRRGARRKSLTRSPAARNRPCCQTRSPHKHRATTRRSMRMPKAAKWATARRRKPTEVTAFSSSRVT